MIDNGAWELKVGYASLSEPLVSVPNCVTKIGKGATKKRLLVADESIEVREAATVYRRPFERGYLVDWGMEKKIWDRVLSLESIRCNPREVDLVCGVAPLPPGVVQDDLAECAFEEYGFRSLFAPSSSAMCGWDPLASPSGRGCMVVDVGYSHSYIVPMLDQCVQHVGVGRVDVGGKALTNYLKELVSFRQWNMMDETWLINHVKERLAYCPQDFEKECSKFASPSCPLVRSYVLPDYVTSRTGWVKEEDAPPVPPPSMVPVADDRGAGGGGVPEQILRMGIERAALGEALFRPTDMGLQQQGIAEGLLHCVMKLPEPIQVQCVQRIVLAGGCANMPGLAERLLNDVRSGLPDDFPMRVECPPRPHWSAWRGCQRFVSEVKYKESRVTRENYLENGSQICRDSFQTFC